MTESRVAERSATENERSIRVTKASVAALSPAAERYIVWDEDLPGFGVRVEPGGHKSYIVRYRAHGGGRRAPRRQMSLGGVAVLQCAAARKQAEAVLALVRLGHDPAQERAATRVAPTIEDLLRFYVEEYAVSAQFAPWYDPRSQKRFWAIRAAVLARTPRGRNHRRRRANAAWSDAGGGRGASGQSRPCLPFQRLHQGHGERLARGQSVSAGQEIAPRTATPSRANENNLRPSAGFGERAPLTLRVGERPFQRATSTGRCNTFAKSLGWGVKVQSFFLAAH